MFYLHYSFQKASIIFLKKLLLNSYTWLVPSERTTKIENGRKTARHKLYSSIKLGVLMSHNLDACITNLLLNRFVFFYTLNEYIYIYISMVWRLFSKRYWVSWVLDYLLSIHLTRHIEKCYSNLFLLILVLFRGFWLF